MHGGEGETGLTWECVGANPTSGTSETQVSTSPNSKPWEQPAPSDSKGDFKYQYHPGGNPANAPRDAPSALHSVIVPNVNLPKVCGNFLAARGGELGCLQQRGSMPDNG